MGYTTRDFWTRRDNNRIYGKLLFPEGADDGRALPMVVCAHGLRTNHGDALPYATRFAEAGFAAYVFDFCGSGPYSASDGDPNQMSLFTEQHDLEAVVWELSRQGFVDASHMFLFGESQGATVAMMAGRALPQLVSGMVLLYPAFNLHELARQYFPDRNSIPDGIDILGHHLGGAYIRSAWDYDFYEQMTHYPNDVLIVHGNDDSTVPLGYAQRAQQAFPHAHLDVVGGGDHGFHGDQLDRAMWMSVEFVAKHCGR
ncbi:MAG: alpha/beta hydrolase [Atopobiaceae bacterium]